MRTAGVQYGRHRLQVPTKKRISISKTLRWSRLGLWSERAVTVPKKAEALIWAMLGITVLNLTLALFVKTTESESRQRPIWIDPSGARIITLFDKSSRPIGFKFLNTTCRMTSDQTYTCDRL